jgi:hypothetical protein
MAQATALILDSTEAAVCRVATSGRVLGLLRTICPCSQYQPLNEPGRTESVRETHGSPSMMQDGEALEGALAVLFWCSDHKKSAPLGGGVCRRFQSENGFACTAVTLFAAIRRIFA